MNYSQFLDCVKELIGQKAGNGYQITLNHVVKNNSLELDGIMIRREDEYAVPNIYLNSYYEEYKKGRKIDEIINDIFEIYQKKDNEFGNTINFSYDFEKIKGNIFYRIVNYNRNKKLLSTVPHTRFLDLAVTYHYLVEEKNKEINSILITKEYLNMASITSGRLMNEAEANTPVLFPAAIRPFEQVIKNILRQELSDRIEKEADIEKMADEILKQMNHSGPNIYVMTNQTGIYGASVLLYKNILKKFSKSLNNCDFYILPSSIHETILLPVSGKYSKENLKEMVFDINRTQVPFDEVLSDQVYKYSFKSNLMRIS